MQHSHEHRIVSCKRYHRLVVEPYPVAYAFVYHVDRMNQLASRLTAGELYAAVQQQAMLVSMKEIFGLLTMAGIACTLVLLLRRDNAAPCE